MSRKLDHPPPPEVLDEFGDSWDWELPPAPTLFTFGAVVLVALAVGYLSPWWPLVLRMFR